MLREDRRLSVFENRVFRGIFGPKRYAVTGDWRKLHNEELSDLYPHPILCGYKIEKNENSGACSAYGGWERLVQGFVGERDHWVVPGVDGKIILIWVFRKWDVGVWTGLSCLMIGTGGGHL